MELKYGFLVDYAGLGSNGKTILVGIFETIFDAVGARPIAFPPCYLYMRFEANVAEGSQHQFEVEFTDQDGHVVANRQGGPVVFSSQGMGRPLVSHLVMFMPNFSAPDIGEYAFHVFLDGQPVGAISVYVQPPPGSIA